MLFSYRKRMDSLLLEHAHAQRRVVEEREALDKAKLRHNNAQEALEILQEAAEYVQTKAHSQIASVVSRCLKAVFGRDAYEFAVRFERKRNKTEATLLLRRGELELEDPLSSAGGGVIDVAAFALRLAALVLETPAKRRFLALDEPFRFVSREYREAVRDLIVALAEEMNVQMLIVTHDETMKIGKVIELD